MTLSDDESVSSNRRRSQTPDIQVEVQSYSSGRARSPSGILFQSTQLAIAAAQHNLSVARERQFGAQRSNTSILGRSSPSSRDNILDSEARKSAQRRTARSTFVKHGDKANSWWNACYSRFLPVSVIDHFCAIDAPALSEPILERFEAAVAFIDISGFTKLSETLAKQHGEHASELLNTYISSFFKRLISVVVDHGGE